MQSGLWKLRKGICLCSKGRRMTSGWWCSPTRTETSLREGDWWSEARAEVRTALCASVAREGLVAHGTARPGPGEKRTG